MKLRFYLFVGLLLFARGCDFYSTSLWIFKPGGLEMETNPLVRYLGFGWSGLLISNLIIVVLILMAYHYYLFRYRPRRPVEDLRNYRENVSYLYFGRKDRWYWMCYRLPKNKRASLAHLGYVLFWALVVGSFLATFHNFSQYYNLAFYDTFREWVGRPLYVLYGLIAVTVVCCYRQLLHREYRMLYPPSESS